MIVMYQMRIVVNTAQIAKQAMLTILSQVLEQNTLPMDFLN